MRVLWLVAGPQHLTRRAHTCALRCLLDMTCAEYNAEMLEMRLAPHNKTTLDFFRQLQG